MELFRQTNIDFLGKKWPFIIASALLLLAGLGSLIAKGGPRYGSDFKGGALVYVKFAQKPSDDQIRSALGNKLPGGVPDVQEVRGSDEVIIGTDVQDERVLADARKTIIDTLASTFGTGDTTKLDLNNTDRQTLVDRLRDPLQRAGGGLGEEQLQQLAKSVHDYRNASPRSGLLRSVDELSAVSGVTPQVMSVLKQETRTAPYAVRYSEMVGPKMGAQLRTQAILATLYALGGMLAYIAFRFEWISGIAAVIAVLHDTLVTLGLFSIFNYEISLTVVAALLTLVGYSMNDKIVVFDRVRENLKLMRRETLPNLINISVNQTLSRTLLTGGLTFLCAVSLLIFGGPVLNGFAFAFVIGIIVGTYSSIFIATPIVVLWQGALERRKRAVPAVVAAAKRDTAKTVK